MNSLLKNSQFSILNSQFARSPWFFIPTLYLAEGLPYVIINTVSVILYKRMGVDNAQITLWTGFLYLPWVIKMFWGPWVDLVSTKRNWILLTQGVMAGVFGLAAFSLHLSNFFMMSLLAFALGAFVSATHDIAVDGFYLLSLSKENQAWFVGIRSFFYRVAMILGSGLTVYFAGLLEIALADIPLSWTLTLGLCAILFILLAFYHRMILPFPASDLRRASSQGKAESRTFSVVIRSYFKQDRIGAMLAFILLYRLGEAMLVKMVAPFLLDAKAEGGLALSTSDVGLAYGTAGVLALMAGGILGGWMISRYGLKRCLWPMALALNLPDLFYVYMAFAQPSLFYVYPLVALEQFGYGLGFSAYMIFMMQVLKGPFKTAHFAISTGFMALGMMIPGMLSGPLQEAVGYPIFFILVCGLALPGMASILFIPLEAKPAPAIKGSDAAI